MPIQSAIQHFTNFTRGLNTESSPLDFPQEFSLDEVNMEADPDGSRRRREGLGFETQGAVVTTTSTNNDLRFNATRWKNADNRTSNQIGVVQANTQLFFMDLTEDFPSANLLNSGAALTLVTTETKPRLSFSNLNGILLVTSEDLDKPLYLSYDTDTDVVSSTEIDIKVRDLWGEDDGLDVTENPIVLSDKHNYNLLNQGWRSDRITQYNTTASEYPDNTEVSFVGTTSAGAWGAASVAIVQGTEFGTTPAPKGKYIIDYFDRGASRETISSVSNLEADQEAGRFTSVTTNFGRVFWAGVQSNITDPVSTSPNASNLILFSQIVENNDQLGKCYQEADPTSERIFEIVASDGGFISIPDLGTVQKMISLNNQVVVLADNGVWTIVAIDGFFTPTNYLVNKISDVGVSGPDSGIEVEGTLIYWSESGIYTLGLNPESQQAGLNDLTVGTIKKFYNAISTAAKTNAKAYYDSIRKRVGWLYNGDSDWDFSLLPTHTNKELIYDFQLEAFLPNTHASKPIASPYTISALLGENIVTNTDSENVVVNNVQVVVNGENVTQDTSSTIRIRSKIKYLTFVPGVGGLAGFTLSSYQEKSFLDWETENYSSNLQTGFMTLGDPSRYKGIPFLVCHFLRTETGFDAELNAENESGCLIQSRWGWSDTVEARRWGKPFQAYRYRRPYVPVDADDSYETGYDTIITRNKIRGWGQSVGFRFESEQGKDMVLLGFSLMSEGAQGV